MLSSSSAEVCKKMEEILELLPLRLDLHGAEDTSFWFLSLTAQFYLCQQVMMVTSIQVP